MKKLFLFIIFIFATALLFAEAPQEQADAIVAPELRQELATPADGENDTESDAYRTYLRAKYLFEASSNEVSADEKAQVPVLLFQAIDAMPENDEPLNLLLEWYAKNENCDELKELFEELLEAHPDSQNLKFYYAIALCDTNDYERAIALLEPVIPKSAFQRKARYLSLYAAYAATNNRAKMTELMEQANADAAMTDSAILKELQLHHYVKMEQLQDAREYAAKLLEDKEFFEQLNGVSGVIEDLTTLNDVILLRQFCLKIINSRDWEDDPTDWARTHATLFICNTLIGDCEGLRKQLDDLRNVSDINVRRNMILFYFDHLHKNILQRKEARQNNRPLVLVNAEYCQAALALTPNPTPKFLELAIQYFAESGKYAEALDALKHVPMPTPDDLLNMAQLHAILKQYDEALKTYALLENTKWDDNDKAANYYYNYAMTAVESGDQMLAIEKLKQAFVLNPNSTTIQNALGYTMADNNVELERAKKLIEFALKKEPENLAIIDSMAWVYFRLGDYPNALNTLAPVIQRLPDDPKFDQNNADILDHLRQILDANGYHQLRNAFD